MSIEEAKQLHRRSVGPGLYLEWHRVGGAAADLVLWLDAGVEPRAAAAWHRKGFTSDGMHAWRSAGVDDVETAAALAKVVRPTDAAAWWSARFDTAGIVQWARHATPEQASEYRASGFSPGKAIAWIVNRFTAHEATDWIRAGLSASHAASARRLGLNAQVLVTWRGEVHLQNELTWWAAGWDAESAAAWSVRGDEPWSKRWRAVGFTPADAAEWSAMGLTPDQAEAFMAHGVDIDQARRADLLPGDSIADAIDWVARGCSLNRSNSKWYGDRRIAVPSDRPSAAARESPSADPTTGRACAECGRRLKGNEGRRLRLETTHRTGPELYCAECADRFADFQPDSEPDDLIDDWNRRRRNQRMPPFYD